MLCDSVIYCDQLLLDPFTDLDPFSGMCRYQCSVLMFLLLLGITLWGYVYYLPGLSPDSQILQAGALAIG